MDKNIKSLKREVLPGPDWQATIHEFITLNDKLGNIHKASMYLPYGFVNEEYGRIHMTKNFGSIGIGTESLDQLFEEGQKDNNKVKLGKENKGLPVIASADSMDTIADLDHFVNPMVMEVGRLKQRRYCRIIQRFPAIVSDNSLRRRSGYYYWWSRKEVLISKTLGTRKYREIQKQASELMRECSRFYLVYCERYINHKS